MGPDERAQAGPENHRERQHEPSLTADLRALAAPRDGLLANASAEIAAARAAAGARLDRIGRRRALLAGGAVVLVLAVWLASRLWIVASFPYFLDEAILASWAEIGKDQNRRLEALTQGIRPGMIWLTLIGMGFGFTSLVSIRLVALGFAFVGWIAGTVLAYRIAGRAAAATFAVVALACPYLLLYDSLGLRDIVIAAMATSGLLLQIELARRPRLLFGFLLGITFAADMLVKDTGKLSMALLPLSLVVFRWREPEPLRRLGTWVACASVALAMAFAATIPMKLSVDYVNLHITQREYGVIRPFGDVLRRPLALFNSSWPTTQDALVSYLTLPVLALALVGLAVAVRRVDLPLLLVAAWAAAGLTSVVFLAFAAAYARYLGPTVPFVLILAAVGAVETWRFALARLRGRAWAPAALTALALLLALPSLIFDTRLLLKPESAPYPALDALQYVTSSTSGFGVEEAAAQLAAALPPGASVVAGGPNVHSGVPVLLQRPDVTFVFYKLPEAEQASTYVTDGAVPEDFPKGLELVWEHRRPRDGATIRIYRRPG